MKREIQISRKTIFTSFLLVVSIALIGGGLLLPRRDTAFLSKIVAQFAGTMSTPTQPDPRSAPDALAATAALNAFYTLDYTESMEQWQERVCTLTTKDGCQLIQKLFAPAVRQVVQANQVKTGCIVHAVRLAQYTGNTRTWLLEVTLDKPWLDEKPTIQVYADVIQINDIWLLNRILFDQESTRFTTPAPSAVEMPSP
jgi:hypothetical protein